jgi:hypothetical protein
VQLWDSEGLPFTIDDPQPVRVVRAEEVLERQRHRHGERTPHATDHEWLWITTLAQSVADARTIRRLGNANEANLSSTGIRGEMKPCLCEVPEPVLLSLASLPFSC